MITGNMILIENKKIYMSIPFCGDMEPEANGRFAYYLLQHLDSKGELKNAVTKFDSLKYDYAKRGFNTRILEDVYKRQTYWSMQMITICRYWQRKCLIE